MVRAASAGPFVLFLAFTFQRLDLASFATIFVDPRKPVHALSDLVRIFQADNGFTGLYVAADLRSERTNVWLESFRVWHDQCRARTSVRQMSIAVLARTRLSRGAAILAAFAMAPEFPWNKGWPSCG